MQMTVQIAKWLIITTTLASACASQQQLPPVHQSRSLHTALLGSSPASKKTAAMVLDDFHAAAAEADGERYFAHLADDAIYMGTDRTERWTVEEFRAYAEPYFSKGVGWAYRAHDRHISFSEDGYYAWFDERLDNAYYGELRGSGVLRSENGVWKIVHYNMVFPIPNEIAKDVVGLITQAIGMPSKPPKLATSKNNGAAN